jgi:pyruvate dehydrogenase E1 component alpha subunit
MAKGISKNQKVQFYKQMLLFRRFEEKVGQSYTKQKFSGFCHLHIGQEALAVGVQQNLRDDDYMISGYRSHTQAIGKGIEPKTVMSELYGKVDGCARGKGGSMHMFSKEKGFLGGHGIVGGQVPIATGVGFAIRYRNGDQVCVCYLGDAAVNQGQFFEALNMAATWNLPVLFIIENNRYGMGTDITRTTSIEKLSERALGFAMDHSTEESLDVLKVYDHVGGIVKKMRKDKKPHLYEALTYRFRGHSVSDPGTYRSKEEVESYRERDSITKLGEQLVAEGIASEEDLKTWNKEIKDDVKKAEAFADNAKPADVSEAWEHNYVDTHS